MAMNLNLANLQSYQGASISVDVGFAGDVNGDGKYDFLNGNLFYSSYTGIAYLIYGGTSLSNINLASLGSSGITFTSTSCSSCCIGDGYVTAGDFNGDGKADFFIGAGGYNGNTGMGYLIYGGISLSNINLASLGSSGITITTSTSCYNCAIGQYKQTTLGDVNGDHKDDFLIGAGSYYYLIYGTSSLSNIDLSNLGLSGITISYTGACNSIASAGDINGDSKADFLIGCNDYSSNKGIVYLIYGSSSLVNINLASLGSSGITITGASTSDQTGSSVASAGDVNGDGKADFLIGAIGYSSNTGIVYLIYGSSSLANINLGSLGSSGITITGANTGDKAGSSVALAGDVNGDGKADFLIGANGYSSSTGIVYLIYGSSNLANINLASIGSGGITITSCSTCNKIGSAIAAGDVNGDGIKDFLLDTRYLIYGAASGFVISSPSLIPSNYPTVKPSNISTAVPTTLTLQPTIQPSLIPTFVPSSTPTFIPTHIPTMVTRSLQSINLATLTAAQGFTITGANAGDYSGSAVSSGGDINGDGKADIVTGSYAYSSNTGRVYVIYGSNSLSNINLASITSAQGIIITGANVGDYTGYAVNAAGDVNGDGKDDIIIGAHGYSSNTGRVYVIYGSNSLSNINLTSA